MDKNKLEKFQKTIKISFKNLEILDRVFIHRSFLNENKEKKIESNERLEFLGDAVLEIIVTKYLYEKYPKEPEGKLTAWRASLVNGKSLSESARKINMGELLYLSKGEEKTGGRERDLLLANSFEALIGAIYIEHGMKAVKNFIIDHILIKLPKIIKEKLYLDPKTHLQELVQAEIGITPVYKVLKEEGPDHSKNFTLGVFLNDKMLAVGNGSSKQEAQVKAAQKALENWQE